MTGWSAKCPPELRERAVPMAETRGDHNSKWAAMGMSLPRERRRQRRRQHRSNPEGVDRRISRGMAGWRWRWDLNPRTGFPVTRFRVLRTHVQARSPASATCSTRPSAGVTEPPRTTTNETRTETRSAVASSAGLGPQPPTLLDESALRECHESRGTRYCERHSV